MSEADAIENNEFPASSESEITIYEMAEAKLFRIINGESIAGCPVYITRNVLSGVPDSKIKVPLTEKYNLDEMERMMIAGMVLTEVKDMDGRTSSLCGHCKHIGCEYHG